MAIGSAGRQDSQQATATAMLSPSESNDSSLARLPRWMPWLQIGLSVLVTLLLMALIGRTREQSQSIQSLQKRVQGLENSRLLSRSNGLEQQVQILSQRLQSLERRNGQLEAQLSQNQRQRRTFAEPYASSRMMPPVLPITPVPHRQAKPMLPPMTPAPSLPPVLRPGSMALPSPADGNVDRLTP